MTRSGRIFLLWVLGVGIAALNTGNNLLYLVLGLMLSAIVASGVLSERTLRGLRVRRLPVDAAFAGEPFPFRWAVSRERGTSFALSFRELGSGFQTEADGRLGAVAAGAERTVRGTLRASHRGPLALARLEVTTLFPLGLFAKTRIFALTDTVLIFPR
ncbi:MAG TPA: DUF58 domain-containing protein, partial [Myxococcaceae bacterium]|nr:DUF58 domain-containing protein [Myxococcaceae bacterium]